MDVLQTAIALIKGGENEAFSQLLEAQPNLASRKLDHGISLLQYAIYCRNQEAIKMLRAKVILLNIFEATCLGELTLIQDHISENLSAVNKVSPDGFSLLGLAAFFGHGSLVSYLLKNGADPNIASANSYQVTPLHSACAIGDLIIARDLIASGADVNAKQMGGVTALHSAANMGNLSIVKLLIENGAIKDAEMDTGETALKMARKQGHIEVVNFLTQ